MSNFFAIFSYILFFLFFFSVLYCNLLIAEGLKLIK